MKKEYCSPETELFRVETETVLAESVLAPVITEDDTISFDMF